MLKLPIIALFLRTIPEGILVIFASHVIHGYQLNLKRILLTGGILGVCTYIARLLPVHFGVHTIILLSALIFLLVKMHGFNTSKAITSALLSFIILSISDLILVFMYVNVLKMSTDVLLDMSTKSILLGLPSLFLLLIILVPVHFVRQSRKRQV